MFLIFAIRDLRQVEIRGSPMESDLAVCITAGLIAFYVCGLLGHAKILKSLWIMTAFAAALRRIVLTRLAGERQAGATAEQPQRDGTEEVVRR